MNQYTAKARSLWQVRPAHLIARGLLIGLLVTPVALNLPGAIGVAQAAPLEDCDADGFDDATGVAVPWPGFDETHGDTPAGPGTADWWVAQNAQTGGGSDTDASDGENSGSDSGDGSSGGSTSGSSSTGTGNSGTGSSAGSSSSGGNKSASSSGASSSGAAASGSAAGAPAAAPAAVAAVAVVATSTAATAPASAASAGSAESSTALVATGTAGAGGSAAENRSLWDALTVGFTGSNSELFAGLSLLSALTVAGGLALGVSELSGLGRQSHLAEEDLMRTEEALADIA